MASLVVVGAQWGDEGKGKIVDMLTPDFDVVVRFQGGNNAGHTVIAGGKKYILRLIPSGILHSGKRCLIANGVVLDPLVFREELEGLASLGVGISPDNLALSRNAHIIMPYHKMLDIAREKGRGAGKIGTTGRGIGPCYEDKAARIGIRVSDLADRSLLQDKIEAALQEKNTLFTRLYQMPALKAEDILREICAAGELMLPFMADTAEEIEHCQQSGGRVLFEGAQGTALDIDHGTYPFVTSSNTVAGGAAAGSGIAPWRLERIMGISKAYTTRVGEGPFPTELLDEAGSYMREKGAEFGSVTGRPRRCGWLDAAVLRYAARLNGLTELTLTKLDVLSGLKTIKVCTAYECKGQRILCPPQEENGLSEAKPVYETLPGWEDNITLIKHWEALPENARQYIAFIERSCGVPVRLISVGPDREQTILKA